MSRRNHQGHRGWALPLLCLVLLLGAVMLTITVHRVLTERTRWSQDDLRRLQAHALAEGGLQLALALLEDPRDVSADCRVQNKALPTGSSFAARQARPGGWVPCRVDLDSAAGADAWRCNCEAAARAEPESASLSSSTASTSAWVDLSFSGDPSQLILTVTARLPKASAPTPSTASSATTLLSRISLVRLRQDTRGVWREVVGSWRDDTP